MACLWFARRSIAISDMDTTSDGLLNHRIKIEQPKYGYRVAVDTVLLAAAVPVQAGDRVLDLGCGVGGVMLCLATRVPGISAVGVEIQDELAELARRNIQGNALQADLKILQGDVTSLSLGNNFDHALMNPPYHDEARHDVSAHDGKRTANTEKEGDLPVWMERAALALKSSGMLTLIHRADRVEEILGYGKKLFGATEILTILPKAGAAAKRVIIRFRKEGQGIRRCRDFVLHKPDGGYSDEAEKILREAEALRFIEAN
ncbi:MAG: methyltransferase [Alphaproteobacteria bacterium]|nr:methyltransferase [Alphaproteobacteria bacterium]